MLTFREHNLARELQISCKRYLEVCDKYHVDLDYMIQESREQDDLVLEFLGKLFGWGKKPQAQAQPQPAPTPLRNSGINLQPKPNQKGIPLGSEQGINKFGRQSEFAQAIVNLTQMKTGALAEYVKKKFLEQFPKVARNPNNGPRLEAFFKSFAKSLNDSVSKIVNSASTMVDGEKIQMGDKGYQMAYGRQAAKANANAPTQVMSRAPVTDKTQVMQ